MTLYKEEHEFIRLFIKRLIKKEYEKNFKFKDGGKDIKILILLNGKKEDGTIELNDKKITINGEKIEKLYKKYKAIFTEIEKKPLTKEDLKKTPLSKMFDSLSDFNNLEKNKTVVNLINKEFIKLGISDIKMKGSLSQPSTINKNILLGISTIPSNCGTNLETGLFNRLKTFLFNEFKHKYANKDEIRIDEINKFQPFTTENVIELKYKEMLIGFYYPERNFIHLLFNPFSLNEQEIFSEEIPENLKIIFFILNGYGIKKTDVSDIQEKLFFAEFTKQSQQKLTDINSQKGNVEKDISGYEKSIRTSLENFNNLLLEEEFLISLMNSNGKGLFKEIEKVKSLPFVEDLIIDTASVIIKFKKTFLPIQNFKRNDIGKSYGKRYFWIGSITFTISPTAFTVKGDVNINGHCHTHGSSGGGPCFGSGEGRNKIYELLAKNQFVDLAKMLWFWIKTHRNSGAYVKMWSAYDSILSQGYPILDEKGKLIEINDTERIKSGEQFKLTKEDNYKVNYEKFNKMKLEA